MTKKIRWVRAKIGGVERMMELGTIKANSLNIELKPTCPCCGEEITALLDITQYGFIEDKFIVLFACSPCAKAWWYNYTLSLIELTGEGHDSHSQEL